MTKFRRKALSQQTAKRLFTGFRAGFQFAR
jgi:hypothetical protein